MKRMSRGFTLVELMVVIGILALLLSITLVAINPSRQFAKANNSKRQNDIVQLSDAIYQNITQNKGIFSSGGSPFVIPLTPAMIASGGTADICCPLVPPAFHDARTCSSYGVYDC
jgi:type IV pilus assembly protein PilA